MGDYGGNMAVLDVFEHTAGRPKQRLASDELRQQQQPRKLTAIDDAERGDAVDDDREQPRQLRNDMRHRAAVTMTQEPSTEFTYRVWQCPFVHMFWFVMVTVNVILWAALAALFMLRNIAIRTMLFVERRKSKAF